MISQASINNAKVGPIMITWYLLFPFIQYNAKKGDKPSVSMFYIDLGKLLEEVRTIVTSRTPISCSAIKHFPFNKQLLRQPPSPAYISFERFLSRPI